ncbi:MAG TPA: bifunctional riboflavin kinase/FAD synthetase [Xanthomonadaceae bacterium]|nr:bifunctional riboflavin kinase/FAD synthetase [Xanthomonadaceae bacterium]
MSWLFRDIEGGSLCPSGSVLCLGAFDGVHCGHRALLERVCAEASSRGLEAVALSMEPVPREYFGGAAAPPRLTAVRDKLRLLREAGMARVGLMRFGPRLAAMEAEDFVRLVLVGRLSARVVVVGGNLRFGHARRGDVALLRRMGAELGSAVVVPDTVLHEGVPVSSTRIRSALSAGDLRLACELLGRDYHLGGRVRHGEKLGRKLGFPTANLPLGRMRVSLAGVFAVRVCGAGLEHWPGVANLGTRPTIGGIEPCLEVHLFGFDGDLYGRRIDVIFVEKLREEARFPDLESMVRQMRVDADQARAIVGEPA